MLRVLLRLNTFLIHRIEYRDLARQRLVNHRTRVSLVQRRRCFLVCSNGCVGESGLSNPAPTLSDSPLSQHLCPLLFHRSTTSAGLSHRLLPETHTPRAHLHPYTRVPFHTQTRSTLKPCRGGDTARMQGMPAGRRTHQTDSQARICQEGASMMCASVVLSCLMHEKPATMISKVVHTQWKSVTVLFHAVFGQIPSATCVQICDAVCAQHTLKHPQTCSHTHPPTHIHTHTHTFLFTYTNTHTINRYHTLDNDTPILA